jgi:WD40 repeat protein
VQDAHEFTKLAQDASRFVMYHKGVIESYPLQTYASALLFSPTKSVSRSLFQHEEAKGITVQPAMSDGWGACLQTLEGHNGSISSVAFSYELSKLASASYDSIVKVWDASSGACLWTLNIGKSLHSLSFDPTSSFLRTEIGLIAILGPGTSSKRAAMDTVRPQYACTSLSPDSIWIKHDNRHVL